MTLLLEIVGHPHRDSLIHRLRVKVKLAAYRRQGQPRDGVCSQCRIAFAQLIRRNQPRVYLQKPLE